MKLASHFDSFPDKSASRVRMCSAEYAVLETRVLDRLCNGVDQSAFYRASAAVVDENLRTSVFLHQSSGFLFSIFSEYKFRRRLKRKIIHY